MKGAFTGAAANKKGLFEVADKGTIFLDEIGETSPAMQVKLLRAIQERTIRRVGGTEEIAVDVRIIAATNRDLTAMVAENQFREDLFYRISVIPLEIPPLRHRRDDIPLLANHFLSTPECHDEEGNRAHFRRSLKRLETYDWPGNVRELENAMERAFILETSRELTDSFLPDGSCPCRIDSRWWRICPPMAWIWRLTWRIFRRGSWKRLFAAATASRSKLRSCCGCRIDRFRHYLQKYCIPA